jgi:hypothetical protein
MFHLLESDTSLMLVAGEARWGEQPHRFTCCWLLQVCMASGMVETRDFRPLNMGMPAFRRLQRFSRTSVGETAKGPPVLAFPKFL